MAILMNGQIWLVANTEHVKPGKGPAYTQIKLKNLQTGSNVERRLRSGEDVDQIDLDRRGIEYLYRDSSGAVFMDMETYEQFNIPDDVLGDSLVYIKPNTQIIGLMYKGQVLSIELPPVVDLEVTETPPGIKHATASNQLKEAVLETGLKTRVPPFINTGEIIRISTQTGEYMSRVTGS